MFPATHGESESLPPPRSVYGVEITMLLIFATLCLGLLGALMLVYADEIPAEHAIVRKVSSTFGSFLMVGSTGSLLYRFIFREYFQRRQNERLMERFHSALARLVPRVVLFGLASINERMDYGALFDSLQRGDELWWLDTYAPGYEDWRASLQGAIMRGAKIKMLVLEPGCNTATLRANEIASEIPPGIFKGGLKQFHDHMVSRASASPNAMEVRTYRDLLGCPAYLIVRNGRAVKAYSSFYLNPASFDFPHFVWEDTKERPFLGALETYIRGKWENSQKQKNVTN
jgi:hypothetical protein